MVVAGLAMGFVAGRRLLPTLRHFEVRDSRSLRVLVTGFTAVSLGVAGGVMGTTWDVVPVWGLFVALVGVTTVDLFHYRIPNAIVFPASTGLLAAVVAISLVRGQPGAIGQAAAAAGLYGFIMAVVFVASGGSLGLGDVKLVVPVGLVIGWLGSGYAGSLLGVLVALGFASLLGAVMGLVVWGIRVWGNDILPDPLADPSQPRQTVFPFAPCLAAAAAVVVLVVAATG